MTRREWSSARAYFAPGRSLLLGLVLTACQLAGPAPAESPAEPARPADPVIEVGSISRGAEARAAERFREAETALANGDPRAAMAAAQDVVERYPASGVSGRALLLFAQSASSVNAGAADEAADRYIGLLDAGDPRATHARLIQARALVDDPQAQADRLLRIAEMTGAERQEAVMLLGQAAAAVTPEERASLLDRVGTGAPLAWVLQVQVAVDATEAGDAERGKALAQAALEGGAEGPDAEIARGVLADRLPGGRSATRAFAIGTVLPTSGPPALADFARLIAEGVEVAAAEALGSGFQVDVIARDDQADPGMAATLAAELESEVQGLIGFLQDEDLLAAGPARRQATPMVSPTARSAAEAGDGAYSLEGADPEAARLIAAYAETREYTRVAIIHSQAPESALEADAFEAAVIAAGIPVVGRYSYEAGATFFEDQILGARDALRRAEIRALNLGEEDTLRVEMLEPVAIFMPIPPEDIEFVGPQVSHFALDTLAIEMLGTSAWTDPQVLESVAPRHTTGVVATAPVGVGPGWEGEQRFRDAYERHFQRSLISPVPAVGWDATLLLLEALREGSGSAGATRAAFERLSGIRGATGVFSVRDGRIVREKEIVYVDNATLVPIG